jgi:DNA-binding NarL/FixJ family response regulator
MGAMFIYPTNAKHIIEEHRERDSEDDPISSDKLTPRENQVLILIADGLTNSEIGEKLGISHKTVDRHRENIMGKLDLHSRIDLTKYAIRNGLIDLDKP